MNWFWKLEIVAFVVIVLAEKNDGLRCYACASSGQGSECEISNKALLKQRFDGGSYNRQCDGFDKRFCSIESYSQNGKTMTYIRDCSNGRTFSQTTNTILVLERIKPDNQTVCSNFNGNLICLSLCYTDFCNGPLKEDYENMVINAAPHQSKYYVTLAIILVFYIV